MRIAYADPPYVGCAKYYPEKQEIDMEELICKLLTFDRWALSASSSSLKQILSYCPDDVRIASWVKPFCSYKPNVNPAYAWEPVVFWNPRKRTRTEPTVRDWVSENITLRKGLVGAKPVRFCYWLFDLLGAESNDEFFDLFPGTGIVTQCWKSWVEASNERQLTL